jgi:tetratricopeptide (TPR) repeat protein
MRNGNGRRLARLAVTAAATAALGTAAARAGADDPAASLLDPAYVARSVCGPTPQRRTEVFKPGFQLAAGGSGTAAPAEAGPRLRDDLGSLTFPVTTADPEAQRWFDQGLRFAFAFNHAEAARAFKAAQAADPTCAMCYWGEAWALGPNINWPMQPEAVAPAFAAVAQAMALRDGATERERALIGALAVRYAADPAADRAVLDRAYADAMAAVAARHGGDDTVQTLFADALMNLQPWDYWAPDKATPKGRTAEQVEALERVLRRNPDHPGAIHLYIHTVEASTTPERAEPFADRLGGLMPGAGHLVHMPAHIYYRVGRYLDSLDANIAAAKADEALLAGAPAEGGIYRFGYYPHNVHFVLVSAAMAGDAGNALAAAGKLGGITSDEVAKKVSWIEAIKQAPYFAHARFSPPGTVLALPPPPEAFPYVGVSWRYARALALVRKGDLAAAEGEARALADLSARVDHAHLAQGLVPSEPVVSIANKVVAARLAQARGDLDGAVALFREAAALEDGLPYMEPPWWPYPVRQSLGAALLQAGRVEEAAQEFQSSLVAAPNNAYALHGLAAAQEKLGDLTGAAATRARFARAWAGGDTLPELRWM